MAPDKTGTKRATKSALITPGPSTVVGYYQNGLFYRAVDDVNQYRDFYALHSNNRIDRIDGLSERGFMEQHGHRPDAQLAGNANHGTLTASKSSSQRGCVPSCPYHLPGSPLGE